MNSLKCPSCGLVNFADAAACKRCASSFQLDTSSTAALTMPETYTPIMPIQNDVRNVYANNYGSSEVSEDSGVYIKKIIFGALWAGGGTIATVLSYGSASGGGKYFIFWGAILFGIIDLIIGLNGYLGSKDS